MPNYFIRNRDVRDFGDVKENMLNRQNLLYFSIFFVVIFVCIVYFTDYLFTITKPEYIKTNGKPDKNKQFLFSLGFSLVIVILLILLTYQIIF